MAKPAKNEPKQFTIKVPTGKRILTKTCTMVTMANRDSAPNAPPQATVIATLSMLYLTIPRVD
ncbi:hypothetical protein [Legionella oakridgensis]|uniref:hypothetical protein n=1 Tax=Legionella oakridgensis TaxID=29423 RepID=UPI001EE67B2A|nr:hypothetical protein [Legionella oakridgensis]